MESPGYKLQWHDFDPRSKDPRTKSVYFDKNIYRNRNKNARYKNIENINFSYLGSYRNIEQSTKKSLRESIVSTVGFDGSGGTSSIRDDRYRGSPNLWMRTNALESK